jgi:hypothetical protein
MEKGLNDGGFLVCKFIFRVCSHASPIISALSFFFQRVPGQTPLQRRDVGETDDDDGSDEDATTAPVEHDSQVNDSAN